MKISVYIPSYNQKEYLFQAVESVLNQTLRPFEILIIDDCSTDGSQELIRNLANANPLVRYLFNETNEGIAGVRRKALENVRGDYFTYVDGDDLYLPNKLSIEAGLMNSGKYDVAFSNNMYVDPDDPNDVKWIWAYNKSEFPSPGNMHYETLARKFPRMSLFRMELINVDLLKSIGTYDQNLQIYEDYDFRVRLSERAKINFSLEPTTKIRISKNGLSKSDPEVHRRNLEYIFAKHKQAIKSLPPPLKSRMQRRMKVILEKHGPSNGEKRNAKDTLLGTVLQLFRRKKQSLF